MSPASSAVTQWSGDEPLHWVAGSTPYPWPYDGRIEAGSLALLVITPTGPEPGRTGDRLVDERIAALREAVLGFGAAVIDVTTSDPSGRLPASGDVQSGGSFEAPGWDGFFGTGLDAHLRRSGITHLLLAGAPTETGVHSTMRSANDRGYECLLVADATRPLEPELLPRTLSMVEMSGGIFGAIGSTTAVLEQLTR